MVKMRRHLNFYSRLTDSIIFFALRHSEVRQRLKEQQANRINKEGFLSLQSQEYRTQAQNKKDAISKLKEMLLAAWPRPKIRKQRKGPTKAEKERNKEFKKKRSETKARRGRVDF